MTPSSSRGTAPQTLVTLVLMLAGALLSLLYAGWAFTARRGIFADFADGVAVTSDDATSSDRIDTVFLVVAGLVTVAALVLWVLRRTQGRTPGGTLEVAGLATCGLGVLVVLLGLFLSDRVSGGGSTAEQGERGVTATIVVGGGFLLLSAGLLVGAVSLRQALARHDTAAR